MQPFRFARTTEVKSAVLMHGSSTSDASSSESVSAQYLAGGTTLLDLMNHSSGYPDYYPLDFVDRRMQKPISPDDLIQQYAGRKLDFEPGTQWSYSNTGFIILGRIVEMASGNRLLKVDAHGLLAHVAGQRAPSDAVEDGAALTAKFNGPHNLAVLADGDVLFAPPLLDRVVEARAPNAFLADAIDVDSSRIPARRVAAWIARPHPATRVDPAIPPPRSTFGGWAAVRTLQPRARAMLQTLQHGRRKSRELRWQRICSWRVVAMAHDG